MPSLFYCKPFVLLICGYHVPGRVWWPTELAVGMKDERSGLHNCCWHFVGVDAFSMIKRPANWAKSRQSRLILSCITIHQSCSPVILTIYLIIYLVLDSRVQLFIRMLAPACQLCSMHIVSQRYTHVLHDACYLNFCLRESIDHEPEHFVLLVLILAACWQLFCVIL